jgi:hypothetical protein
VLVELTPEAHRRAGAFYGPHMAQAEKLFRRYTREQIELLLDFVRDGREFNERQAEEVERSVREGTPWRPEV